MNSIDSIEMIISGLQLPDNFSTANKYLPYLIINLCKSTLLDSDE